MGLKCVLVENTRKEVQDFVGLCETLLSQACKATPMNIVECAVVRHYASRLINRCDALLQGKDEQTLEDLDDPPGSLSA